MLKQTVTYTDYNDADNVETLYFNITKTELLEFSDELMPRLEAWQGVAADDARKLTEKETRELLWIVKFLVRKAYGKRTADGTRFIKSDEIYEEFTQMAVYDEFLFGLFQNPDKMIAFMTTILPKDLVDEAKKTQAATDVAPLPGADGGGGGEAKTVEQASAPRYILEDRDPTPAEVAVMTREEMQEAFRIKIQRA